MTNTADLVAVRALFDAIIADTTDPDLIAKRELLREWFTNPAFRTAMADEVYALTRATA